MIVALDEMKNYLRVDYDDDDAMIMHLLESAEQTCMDVARETDTDAFEAMPNARIAVLYTAAYLYEHREEADHNKMLLTLRALLFGSRKEAF